MAGSLLSDAEIDRLLDEAENRLREKAASVTTSSTDALSLDTGGEAKRRKSYVCALSCRLCFANHPSFPKLQHSLAKAAYIKDNQGVAQTSPQAIVGNNGRNSASAELKPVVPQGKSKKTVSVILVQCATLLP